MGKRGAGRLSGLAAVLAVMTLLLTGGASSGTAVSSPLVRAEEPVLMKRVAAPSPV